MVSIVTPIVIYFSKVYNLFDASFYWLSDLTFVLLEYHVCFFLNVKLEDELNGLDWGQIFILYKTGY